MLWLLFLVVVFGLVAIIFVAKLLVFHFFLLP
jgi:hypothetical protein